MALQANHQVKIPGANKTQATALAIEFWTGKGFIVHTSSYNCIVLRSNRYGSIGRLYEYIFGGGVKPWDQHPMELTVLCQVLPQETKWNLSFKLPYTETDLESFTQVTKSWCNEFSDFCLQWMKNAD
jgi:hypothetical protein